MDMIWFDSLETVERIWLVPTMLPIFVVYDIL